LLIIDPVVVYGSWGAPPDERSNTRARPLRLWSEAITAAGLRLADITAATVLLDGPADTRSPAAFRLRLRFWETLCRAVYGSERRGAALGAAFFAFDSLLVRASRTGPSLKCLAITTS
jgi:hypothetical protein